MAITHPGIDLDFSEKTPKEVKFPLRLKGLPNVVKNAVFYIGLMVNGAPAQPVQVTMVNGQPVAEVTAPEGASVQTSLGYVTAPGQPIQWVPNSSKTIQVPVQNVAVPQLVATPPTSVQQSPVDPLAMPMFEPNAPSTMQHVRSPVPVSTLSKDIRGPVLAILEAVKTPEKAGGLSALFDMLEDKLREHADSNGVLSENRDFNAAVAHELHTLLLADASVPQSLKLKLNAKAVPQNIYELQETLLQARAAFRKDVLGYVKADPASRKFFGISRTQSLQIENPFSNPEHNRLFDVACSGYDFGALSTKLNAVIGELSRLPNRDAVEQKKQKKLQEEIMRRLSPEETETMKKWKPRLINQAMQVAGYGALYAGAWWTGAAVLLGRPVLESLTGITAKDIKIAVKERKVLPFLKAMWENNFLSRRAFSTATIGEDLKDAGNNILKKVMPVYGPLAHDEEGTISETTQPNEALTLIRAACAKAAA